MYNTINIQGSNYKLNLSKYYLDGAEEYLIKSKQDKKNEKEYLKKAEELIEKARIVNILPENNMKLNEFALAKKPNTKFKDIAGLEKIKEKINLKVIEPLKNQKLFELFGKKFGGGIIMYGPPGCGKSFIAEATAGEANVAYFNVKVSDIKSKYVGETEQNISKLFKLARDNQPCIIFFDEFESLGQDRNSAIGHDKSMISQLLTEINSLGNKDQKILLIAATNEPWSIDLALRREGRFGSTLFVPPPDFSSRKNILKIQLDNKPIEDIDFDLIAKATEFYSGADMVEICNKSIENVLSECLKNNQIRKIKTIDLLQAIKNKKELITVKWFKKALDIIYATDNTDSFNEVIEYANNSILQKQTA